MSLLSDRQGEKLYSLKMNPSGLRHWRQLRWTKPTEVSGGPVILH